MINYVYYKQLLIININFNTIIIAIITIPIIKILVTFAALFSIKIRIMFNLALFKLE